MGAIRLLSVEDDENDSLLVVREIRRGGIEVGVHRRVDTLAALRAALDEAPWDVCVCDFNLGPFDARSVLGEIARRGVDLPTLVVTGSLDEEQAALIFRSGGRDLITKNRLARLVPAIRRELLEGRTRREAGESATALRRSQDLVSAFMQHLPALVTVRDTSCRHVFANEAFRRFFGVTDADLLARTTEEALGPELARRMRGGDARARAGGANENEARFEGADGEERDFRVHEFLVGAEPELLATVAFDVTDRKRAERAARANEERFHTVADAIPDPMLTVTEQGQIRHANRAAARLLGWSPDELTRMTLEELTAAEQREQQFLDLAYFASGRRPRATPQVIARRVVAKDGTAIDVEVSAAGWALEGERFVTGVMRDTRERRALEEQMRQAQKMEAVGQLAGGVAHDFNNILGVISAYTDLLWESLVDDAGYDDIEEIRLAVRRGTTLVSQLLMFARKQRVEAVDLDVNAVVSDLANMLRRAAGPKVECVLDLDLGRPGVHLDRGHLEQVLMNLVVNARDAIESRESGPPGRIVISTRSRPQPLLAHGIVEIGVGDNGCGMDDETRRRAFEPFFTTKELGKGTGLGLSTTHGIVERAGGRIEVLSAVGEGTVFTIALPGAPLPRPSAVVPNASPRPCREGPQGRRAEGLTIVVVECPLETRRGAARVLRREGHHVVEIRRADQALPVVRALGPSVDLLVVDVDVPVLDLEGLVGSAEQSGSPVPMLLLGGAGETWGHRDASRRLARVKKPIVVDELLERVAELCLGARKKGAT